MRKTFLALMTLTIISQVAVAGWQNTLAPAGESKSIVLTKDGRANYKVIEGKSPKAAKLLQTNLKLLTGINFNGEAPLTISLKEDMLALGIDGYAIEVKDGNIILHAGSKNGISNAVTSLLEEDLGWRYYQKNQKAVSPAGKITKAQVVPRRYVPPFYQRAVYSYWAFDPAWDTANKTRKGNFAKYFCHTFLKFIPPAEFFKSNPEYFALSGGKRVKRWQDGQLCMTNPELRKLMAQKVIKAIKDSPGIEFIALDQTDAEGYCECPACAALLKQEKNPSGPLLHFVNAVAAEVGKVYPAVTIVTLAYRYSLEPPAKVKPAANVAVRLCFNNRINEYPFFFVEETNDAEILNAWSKISNRLLIWDYMINFRNFLVPRADLPVLEKNIKLYRDKKVLGVMMQTNYSNELGTEAAMRAWLCAKLLWNPDLSIEKLAHDYINGFWGKDVAPFMLKYNALLIKEWREFHSKNKPGTTFIFSKSFYGEADKLLKQAMVAAKSNPTLLKELEIEELTLDDYLLQKGVRKAADIPAYKTTLARLTRKLEKYNITHLSERTYNKYKERLEQYADGLRMFEYTKTIPAKNIVLPATRNVYIKKGLTKDKNSLVGTSIRQEPTGAWDVQWRFEDFYRLIPGKYKVRIRARADKNKKTTKVHGTYVGVWDVKKKSYALRHAINATDLDDKKYKWIDCGTLEIVNTPMYLYTTTAKDAAFSAFYVDAVEFIPIKSSR